MIDSCSARNAEPGFAQQYSKPSDLITSTMKSEPGRSLTSISAEGTAPRFSVAATASGAAATRACCGADFCALAPEASARTAAAPAAPLRNPRRPTEVFPGVAIFMPFLAVIFADVGAG